MRRDDSGALKPLLGWIGAWGALKGENVMFSSEEKVLGSGGMMLPHRTRTRMKAAIPDHKQENFSPCFGRTFQEKLDLKKKRIS